MQMEFDIAVCEIQIANYKRLSKCHFKGNLEFRNYVFFYYYFRYKLWKHCRFISETKVLQFITEHDDPERYLLMLRVWHVVTFLFIYLFIWLINLCIYLSYLDLGNLFQQFVAGTLSVTLLRPRQTHEPLDYATHRPLK